MWSNWTRFLVEPVDGASLGIFRILFYLVMTVDIYRYFAHDWIRSMFIRPEFLFSWFPFITPWPDQILYIHFQLAFLAALLSCLGLFYRQASIFFFLSITYFFLLDKANFINHFYLICLLSFLMCTLPAARCFSLDAALVDANKGKNEIPRWTVLILRAQILIVYFYAALWKFNPDWLSGVPCKYWMSVLSNKVPVVAPVVTQEWFGQFLAFGGLATDCSVPILISFPQTFWLGALMSLCFHLMNSFLFRIGVFPFLMLGTLALFPGYSWPRHVWALIRAKLQLTSRRAANEPAAAGSAVVATPSPTKGSGFSRAGIVAALAFFHIYLFAQMVVPLRFLAYPGDPDWTEQGYYFCWRMMLHHKQSSYACFVVRDPSTAGIMAFVTGKQWLNRNQRWNMGRHPELAHQFSIWLADKVEQKTGRRPVINVILRSSMHGRPWQYLIDPHINLAAQPVNFQPKEWIVPISDAPPQFLDRKYKVYRKENFGKLAGKDPNGKWW